MNGANPQTTLILSGSTLYGTTEGGGAYGDGEVFSLPLTGGTPTVLASFDGANGESPIGNLVLSGDTLYGTTFSGGTDNDGTVFSVPITGGILTDLVSFNGPNGQNPSGGVTLSQDGGTLYGTTELGGAGYGSDGNDDQGEGTVFAVSTTAVPEPISLPILILSAAALTTRRRHTRNTC